MILNGKHISTYHAKHLFYGIIFFCRGIQLPVDRNRYLLLFNYLVMSNTPHLNLCSFLCKQFSLVKKKNYCHKIFL